MGLLDVFINNSAQKEGEWFRRRVEITIPATRPIDKVNTGLLSSFR